MTQETRDGSDCRPTENGRVLAKDANLANLHELMDKRDDVR